MKRMAVVLACSMACAGCGGTMLLKSPVAQGCRDAGLKGCEELTEGVLVYVGGDKEAGKGRIQAGAGANDPAKLGSFAAKLRTVAALPGLGGFSGQLAEVASVLEAGGARGPGPSAAVPPASVVSSSPSRATKVDGEDAAGTTVTAIVAGHPKSLPCEPFGKGAGTATCLALGTGPLVVSDVMTTGACAFEVTLLAGMIEAPSWALVVPPKERHSTHGARLVVAPFEDLAVAVRTNQPMPRDPACGVTVTTTRP